MAYGFKNDYGFSTVKEDDLPTNVENSNTIWNLQRDLRKQEEKYENRIHDVLNAIQPLMERLKDNSEHEYIKWPNRVEAIEKFVQQLKDIAFPEQKKTQSSVPSIKELKKDGSTSNT